MEREGFSFRRTTTKKKMNLNAVATINAITNFFLDTRVFQETVPNITPLAVFNRDQVPMALASSCSITIDDKNKDII